MLIRVKIRYYFRFYKISLFHITKKFIQPEAATKYRPKICIASNYPVHEWGKN